MLRIDAHQHFWHFDPVRDAWITADMALLRRDFQPADFDPLLQQHGFVGCVAVQAAQSEAETHFLLELAAQHRFIRGVVGWADLQAPNVAERLTYFRQFPLLKGFRHILEAETDRALMLTPAFQRGIAALQPHGFTYDLLIQPEQLRFAARLAAAFPEQPFVVDHLAKPRIRSHEIGEWEQDLYALAAHQNVWCKVSGLVTEAEWQHSQPEDFRPYLDVAFDAFGAGRLMYGSDWPVCELAGGYTKALSVVEQYAGSLTPDEQAGFWGGNATRFYQL